MKNIIILLAFLILLSKGHSYPQTPNPYISPGDICTIYDSDFQEFRYIEKIPYCTRNVTFARRTNIYNIYNIDPEKRSEFTIDHIIPLALGGSNSDLNLWPEHIEVKKTRPRLETCLYHLLRRGDVTQQIAIDFIIIIKFKKRVDGFDPPTLSLLKGCLGSSNHN